MGRAVRTIWYMQAIAGARDWHAAEKVKAHSFRAGCRRLATALGLRGPFLGTERVGDAQWSVNVDGKRMSVCVTGCHCNGVNRDPETMRQLEAAS